MKATHIVCLMVSSLKVVDAWAEERVYSTVDAQGRVQMIKSDTVKTPPVSAPQVSPTTPPSAPQKSSQEVFRQLDDEVYVDSDYLEQKSFNIEEKKRFYYVPNGGFGEQVIESDDGAPIAPTMSKAKDTKRPASYSALYQELTQEWLASNTVSLKPFCNNPKKLKKQARAFKRVNALWLGSDEKTATEVDRVLALAQVSSTQQTLRLSSFATTHKNPKFYVPIVSFLNAQGCVLSGAWQYWSQSYPANDNQFSAVEGLLRLPVGTQYVVFSRPMTSVTVDLPLQNTGSLIVEYY